MFKALIGDMFASDAKTLVNTVNCVGIMGKGVAQGFKERFPDMYKDYKQRCDRKLVKLGEPYLYEDLSGTSIINFPTKDHWRSSSRLSDIERGLDYLASHVSVWKLESLSMPPLGCGNGGLEWAEVAPLVYRKLHKLPVDVELYAPYGTPRSELTEQFLSTAVQLSLEGKGRQGDKLNSAWLVLMEVLRDLAAQPYANPVGRTIFQKICYVVTETGVPTGFKFEKGSYGPFSNDVQKALHVFANKNWIQEANLGRMVALKVAPQYEKDRSAFLEKIGEHRRKIDKTVDLFSRIKSTEQAEVMLTVLFASRQLKSSQPNREVTEQQLFDYILDWKKSWQAESKSTAVAASIRSLVILGWMRLQPSSFLALADLDDDGFSGAAGEALASS